MPSLAERMFETLRGFDRAHGNYLLSAPSETGQKSSGRGVTRAFGPSVALWEQHLAGTYRLGIVPIMADDTCVWGAVDVDDYNLNLPSLNALVVKTELPLTVVRTKSGGAHLYVFFTAPVAAARVRAKLKTWASAIGYATAEIFPKQDNLDAGGVGNWLNAPYFGGDRSNQYALGPDGSAVSVEAFLDLIAQRAVDPERLDQLDVNQSVAVTVPPAPDDLSQAPPCLVTLLTKGVSETEGRNETLFNVAVYLKKSAPDEVEPRLILFNGSMRPPLGPRELRTIYRSAMKRTYNYACSKQPLQQHCDRKTCVTRRFGVASAGLRSDGQANHSFGELIKLQLVPPVWIWSIDRHRVQCSTEDLFNQRKLAIKYTDVANGLLRPSPPSVWIQLVADRLSKATLAPPVPDSTEEGQMISLLKRYCTGRSVGRTVEELSLGKPFVSGERVYFRASDFLTYLSQNKMKNVDASKLYTWLYEHGLDHHVIPIKGGLVEVWSVAKFEGTQTQSYDTPRTINVGDKF